MTSFLPSLLQHTHAHACTSPSACRKWIYRSRHRGAPDQTITDIDSTDPRTGPVNSARAAGFNILATHNPPPASSSPFSIVISGLANHVGASEAPEHSVKVGIEIAVVGDDVSRGQQRGLDFVATVVLPKPEPVVHSASDDHSSDDNDSDGEPVLSDDVDSEDEVIQERFKRQMLRELMAGKHDRRVRKNGDYGCPFCNHKINNTYSSIVAHARGRAVGSFKQKYSRGIASRRILTIKHEDEMLD